MIESGWRGFEWIPNKAKDRQDTHSANGLHETFESCIFLGEFDPSRHFYWLAEGESNHEKMLDVRAFLPLCQFLYLAAWV